MPYSDYRPDLMGSAVLEPTGRFDAGSWQSFTLVYTAGEFGIDDTGSLKIAFRFATDLGAVQFDDPKAPGYTTLEASNGATLNCRWEFKRNIRPWSRSLYIGIAKHFLAEGDTITIRFGDQREGSPGIRLQTYCEKEYQFKVFVDPIATYDYVALPNTPRIEIGAGKPEEWLAIVPTLVKTGEPFRLSIKANDEWGNPSDRVSQTLKLEASGPVEGLLEEVTFEKGAFAHVVEGLSLKEPSDVTFRVLDKDGNELAVTNTVRAAHSPDLLHFWGDLHGQSNETLGTNTAEDYFLFGRDRAFLDVCSHQGNDFQMTQEFWQDLNALTKRLDEPGRYVCFPGYEWSANTAIGGDRNVFYREEGRPIYRSSHAQIEDRSDADLDAHNAHELFEKLKDEDCVMYCHCGGRYADITFAHDGRLETAIEIHSAWGTFDWLLQDAFSKNYRVGIVCNSDGHKGRVGASYPGAGFFGALGGFTCFLADKLDRDGIFEAQRRRHHYGTTGNRMYLDVAVKTPSPCEIFLRDPVLGAADSEQTETLMMGDIARTSDETVTFDVEVVGSSPIEKIEVFDGPDLLETYRPHKAEQDSRRIRMVYEGAEYRGRSRTTMWDGAMSVSGNEIEQVGMINNWNLDRGVSLNDPSKASWKAVTTGNFGAIDLLLKDAKSGRLEVETGPVSTAIDVVDIDTEPVRFDGGGLERAIEFQRMPENMTEHHVRHSVQANVCSKGDTRLFVRVTQEDGHRAWSSPVYLFRE
jgi:hypothetical protein